jgi:hypothetical protein
MTLPSASQRKPVTAIRADYELAIAFRVPPPPVPLHRAGWSGDAVAATSFTTAALIGTALALEVEAIASPATRLRKKSVLRMNVSPEVPVGNERCFPSVPRIQRGARLMENASSCTPSFLRAGAVITRVAPSHAATGKYGKLRANRAKAK